MARRRGPLSAAHRKAIGDALRRRSKRRGQKKADRKQGSTNFERRAKAEDLRLAQKRANKAEGKASRAKIKAQKSADRKSAGSRKQKEQKQAEARRRLARARVKKRVRTATRRS